MLRVFENPKLNLKLNTLKKGDELYFKATDVTGALGYSCARNPVRDHVSEEYKKNLGEIRGHRFDAGQNQQANTVYVSEPGLYELIFSSKLPAAVEFRKWVFEEVLPQIRKTGRYELKKDIRAITCFKIENELDLHKKVIDYIRRFHNLIIVVGLGENQDTKQKRIESWQKGYQKGQPDLIVQNCHKDYNGLCIELKTPKGTGELSEAQKETLQRYEQQGYLTLVSHDYDEIVDALKEYCDGIRVPCPRCPRRFKTQETLSSHIKWIHRIGYND